jgi:hypothetical protein
MNKAANLIYDSAEITEVSVSAEPAAEAVEP